MSGSDATGARASYEELAALVVSQAALIAELRAQVAELEARLGANSRNSSRPPSSDGYDKPDADARKRSLRRSSGRKQGGQVGHEGACLEAVQAPDEQVEHPPERCDGCGGDLADAQMVGGGEARQVFDLPERALLHVVEHVAARRRCGCGHVSAGSFPDGVGAPTQYGPGIRALGVYLVVFQHLPYERACQLLADLAGATVSTGTLTAWVTAAAGDIRRFRTTRGLVGYLGLDPRVRQSGSEPARGGRISKQGSASARWALVEAAWSVVHQPGPLHAFYERIRARRGHGIAVVAVARKLACLFWCLLTREQDYAHAQPSLTAKKLRLLEIRAGAPTLKGKRTGTWATRQQMRTAERELARQAEASYKRMVTDRQATAKKAGASVTPGRA